MSNVSGSSRRTFLRRSGTLAAVAAFAAACGSNSGGSKGGGGGSTALTQWYHQYGEQGTEDAVKRYAKAYTKATVTVQWNPGDYYSKLASALLGSSGPDIFEDQLNIDLVQSGQVVPLDDVIASVKSDFVTADIATNTVDGKVYAIPMVQDMQLLYYRKSLLAKAKVNPPTTVDELIDAAKALTTKNVKGLFVGNDAGVSVLGGPALWSAGLVYVKPDHTIGFDDPRAATALGKLRELYSSKSLLLGAPTDWSDPSAFTQGLTAMQWTGLWTMPQIQQAFGDDFGVAAFPKLDASGKPSVPIGTWGAMINGKSKHIDAAKEFIKWLWITRTDFQEDFNTSYGFHLPPRKSIATKAEKLKSGAPADAVSLSDQYAMPAGPPEWTPKMSTAYSDALTNVIKKGADPAKQLATVKTAVQAELKRIFK